MTADVIEAAPEGAPEQDPQGQPVEKAVDPEVAAQIASLALVPTQKNFTPEQKAVLRETGIKNIDQINPAMLQGFLALCLYRGVNPFIREATIMPTEDGWAAILGIDGFRVIAERTGEYLGMTEPEWSGDLGEWHNVWPRAWGRPQAARIGIKRLRPTGVEVFYGVVHTEEYEVYEWVQEEGKPRGQRTRRLTQRWENGRQVKTLLIKCAKAAGFRDAFPRELDGFYAPEEMERLRREKREAEMEREAARARTARREAYEEAQRAQGKPERHEVVKGVQEGVVVNHHGDTMDAVSRLRGSAQAVAPALRARWYPEMPPMLPGESVEEYTNRLTGADGTGRTPYDHGRNRQCALGEHDECTDPQGVECQCPCHAPEAAAAAPEPAAPEVPIDLPLTEEQRVECLRAELEEQAAILGTTVEKMTKRYEMIYEGDPLSTWDSTILLSIVAFWRPRVVNRLRDLSRYSEAQAYCLVDGEYIDWPDVLFGRSVEPVGDGS